MLIQWQTVNSLLWGIWAGNSTQTSVVAKLLSFTSVWNEAIKVGSPKTTTFTSSWITKKCTNNLHRDIVLHQRYSKNGIENLLAYHWIALFGITVWSSLSNWKGVWTINYDCPFTSWIIRKSTNLSRRLLKIIFQIINGK